MATNTPFDRNPQDWRFSEYSRYCIQLRASVKKHQKAKAKKNVDARKASPLIMEYREKGYTFQRIADELNQHGFVTSKGYSFFRSSVKRLYDLSVSA